jgi:hypothetical protein
MDAHPTRVQSQLRGQLICPRRPSKARQAGEQAGPSGLGQHVTRTVRRFGSHAPKFFILPLGKSRSGGIFLALLVKIRGGSPRSGVRDQRTMHRDQGQLMRGGLPGGLHPPDPRRARLRPGRSALHRSRGMHRLRRLRRGLPGRRDHPQGHGDASASRSLSGASDLSRSPLATLLRSSLLSGRVASTGTCDPRGRTRLSPSRIARLAAPPPRCTSGHGCRAAGRYAALLRATCSTSLSSRHHRSTPQR